MGDMAEVFNDMQSAKKARHKAWHEKNRDTIKESGLPYKDRGEALLFRETGKPKVDFYPSTGRWRTASEGRTFRGGAEAFLKWYAKQ